MVGTLRANVPTRSPEGPHAENGDVIDLARLAIAPPDPRRRSFVIRKWGTAHSIPARRMIMSTDLQEQSAESMPEVSG